MGAPSGSISRGARLFGLCAAIAIWLGAGAQAQTTNWWVLNANGVWSLTSNWLPNTNYPDSVGAVVYITNNISADRILTIDTNVTLGILYWGDTPVGSQMDLRTNAAGARLTFDTGDDGRMAVISHSSGDTTGDIGSDSDDTDVGITVADAQGLYIDAYRNITFGGRLATNAIFDGGGHDIIKAEDGTVFLQRIVTNINTIWVRDGDFRIDPEGLPEMRPSFSTVVVGVASGVVDAGEANPLGTVTNLNEGSVRDRRQFAMFELIGAAATNSTGVAMTNDFNVVMNRGIFRFYNRNGPTNGPPAVYSGNFQLNGDANEVFFQTETENTTALLLDHVITGSLTGSGGFTKMGGNGELVLVNSNSFTGAVNILRANDSRRGETGGVRLQGLGTLSGVSAISLQRDGSLFIDNSGVNVSDRINDAATITTWGRSQIEFLGNSAEATYERIGITTITNGRLAIEFDSDNISPQAHTLEIASLNRARGTIVGFHASDVLQGAFATNGPGSITVNLLDGGASLTQIGGTGANTTDRKVVVGVFGGDGVDNGQTHASATPNRADEFMTVDGGRLRTLRPDEMVYLGGRSTNALFISQASANVNDNVNIDFESAFMAFGSYDYTNGLNTVITKRVVGDSTFNSIRLGLVQGDPLILGTTTNAPTDISRSLLIDDGVRLRSESGMLLMGRDTGSTNGDVIPGGNVLIYNGTLDLDGASNNREGIIQNDSGNNLYLRAAVEASQGLTKGGTANVLLDVPNRLGGTVSIAQGNLYVRSGSALDGATGVRVNGGDSLLILSGGVAITNDIPLNVSPMALSTRVILGEAGHNLWGGDIRINNVDNQGTVIAYDMRLGAGLNAQTAALTILGDIGRVDAGATPDIFMIDPPQVSTIESAGILNLMGTFGDRLDGGGNAVPFDPTGTGQTRVEAGSMLNRAATENDLLRFRIDGPGLTSGGDELVVNIYNPWNAAGRIDAQQGTIRFLGDPALGKGEFWTSNALAVANFADGLSGFLLGGSGTDIGGSVTFLLTKNGQVFNAERWTVDNTVSTNVITMGLEHFGPSNATVTIGNYFDDGSPDGTDNRITISGGSVSTVREFRLFAHDGYDSATTNETVGRVNVIQSIRGNDFSVLTKVGSGTVALQGVYTGNTNVYDEQNDIRNFNLLGGELILDRSTNGVWDGGLRRTTDGRAALTLAGGDITHLGRNTSTSELLTSNLTINAGDSRVSVVAGGGNTTELFVGTGANTIVTRQRGGTVGFVEDNSAGGVANIRLAGTGIAVNGRVGSWATYGTNYGGGAYTWASTDDSSNVIAFAETGYSLNTFGTGNHVHLDGVPGIPVADETAASLRYTNATALDMGGFSLNVTEGGILITPTVAGSASIGNGQLTSSGGELIFHNYAGAGGSFAISAGITGNVDLTFSGTGLTVLTGKNTFNGATRINGGTVQIDDASRLGAGNANLEMRGGTLYTTASMFLSNRTVILGGDGGNFNVAGGTTNVLGVLMTETNFLGSARINDGHGDLIKTGAGTLALTYSIASDLTQTTNTYQGLTDIRGGTLRILGTNNFTLGSSKSFYDGTIVRDGATLALGRNSTGTVVGTTYTLSEWMTFEQGSTLRVEDPGPSYQSPSINGVVNFIGDATVWVEADEFNFNSTGAGYVMGSGSIIKDGNGTLRLYNYSPEFTGGIIVKDGLLEDYGFESSTIPNASSITIGLNNTNNLGTVGFNVRTERNGVGTPWTITQNIIVQGNSDNTRLGVRRADHNDEVNFLGGIDMANLTNRVGLQLWYERDIGNRNASGGDAFREEAYINLSGDISGGDKGIRTIIEQNGGPYTGWTQSQERVEGSQVTNEPNFMVFWTLSGSNTGWTGSLESGNRASTSTVSGGPDRDKQHFVRFGNNDGGTSYAIGANNQVVLRHDATLQAYGSQVTIGNLYSDGDSGGSDGFWGSQLVSNTYLENGGTVAGSFTINQTTNRVFNGIIRDGTYYSPATTNLPSAGLSIIKAGSGVLTFDRSNYYTGTTTVREGLLQIAGTHLNGGLYSIENGGSLGGTGIVGSTVSVLNGGILAPGLTNDAIVTAGTFNINAGLTLSNSSILSFDLDGFDSTKGAGVNDLVQGIGNLVLDGVLHIEPLSSFTGAGTNDFWTLMTYSGSITDNGVGFDASTIALLDPGLMFYVYNFEAGAIDEVRLGIMVPEPYTWALLVMGLSILGWMARRRKR